MAELSIDPDYLRNLIVKVRAVMGKDGTVVTGEASNFTIIPCWRNIGSKD